MANWCSNNITFSGDEKSIHILEKLLQKTITVEDITGKGQLLHGIDGPEIDGYMFCLVINDTTEEEISIQFESKWNPIPLEMVRIAKMFNLTFEYWYEESSLHGRYVYENNELTDQCLTDDDVDACRFKEPGDEEDEISGLDYEQIESRIMETNAEPVSIESVP